MQDPERIVHAIAAHAKWKFYLRQAIDTGTSEWTVAEVRPDDGCEFGTWLLALPPGSRGAEVRLLPPLLLQAARLLKQRDAGLSFVIPAASAARRRPRRRTAPPGRPGNP